MSKYEVWDHANNHAHLALPTQQCPAQALTSGTMQKQLQVLGGARHLSIAAAEAICWPIDSRDFRGLVHTVGRNAEGLSTDPGKDYAACIDRSILACAGVGKTSIPEQGIGLHVFTVTTGGILCAAGAAHSSIPRRADGRRGSDVAPWVYVRALPPHHGGLAGLRRPCLADVRIARHSRAVCRIFWPAAGTFRRAAPGAVMATVQLAGCTTEPATAHPPECVCSSRARWDCF